MPELRKASRLNKVAVKRISALSFILHCSVHEAAMTKDLLAITLAVNRSLRQLQQLCRWLFFFFDFLKIRVHHIIIRRFF